MPSRLGWGAVVLGCDRTFPAEAIGVGVRRLKTEAIGVDVEFPGLVQPAKASVSPQIFALSQTEFMAIKAYVK
jgi:hypothetical protein